MNGIDLNKYVFFKGMKSTHLDLLSNHVTKEVFKANEYIFKENEPASKFFLILKGKISVEMLSPEGKPFSIQTAKEGDILGWSWMIPPHQWKFSARVLEPAEMLIMDGAMLREKSKKDYELGYELFRRLADIFVQRLQATRQQLIMMYHGA